jgi:hypothetical protein
MQLPLEHTILVGMGAPVITTLSPKNITASVQLDLLGETAKMLSMVVMAISHARMEALVKRLLTTIIPSPASVLQVIMVTSVSMCQRTQSKLFLHRQ